MFDEVSNLRAAKKELIFKKQNKNEVKQPTVLYISNQV